MNAYAAVLRGERQDLTGFGEWNIICNDIEHVMNVKVITMDQWNTFIGMNK